MDNSYICCFTGHREINERDAELLSTVVDNAIEKLITCGVKVFRAGGALGFDTVVALKVLEKKKKYPFIKLHLYLPCPEQADSWSEENRRIYSQILNSTDKVVYASQTYRRGCMLLRDRMLVDGSDFCIAYCKKKTGGTAYTLDYAQKNSLRTLNIAPLMEKDNKNRVGE